MTRGVHCRSYPDSFRFCANVEGLYRSTGLRNQELEDTLPALGTTLGAG